MLALRTAPPPDFTRQDILKLIIQQLHHYGLHGHASNLAKDAAAAATTTTTTTPPTGTVNMVTSTSTLAGAAAATAAGTVEAVDTTHRLDLQHPTSIPSTSDTNNTNNQTTTGLGTDVISSPPAPAPSPSSAAAFVDLGPSSELENLVYEGALRRQELEADTCDDGDEPFRTDEPNLNDHPDPDPDNNNDEDEGSLPHPTRPNLQHEPSAPTAHVETRSFSSKPGRYATTAIAVSDNGGLMAVGLHTVNQVQVFDLREIKARAGQGEWTCQRSFQDHSGRVTDIAFHPSGQALASASEDTHIKIYDVSSGTGKRSFRYLQDTAPIRSISFHPSGRFLLAGTDDRVVRLYDVQTLRCHSTSNPHHSGHQQNTAVNHVAFSSDARHFVTAGEDGFILIWDSVQSTLIRRIPDHAPLVGASFSQNGKYILSTNEQGSVRLWDWESAKMVINYQDKGRKRQRQRAIFVNDESLVVCPSIEGACVVWDARNGKVGSVLQESIVRVAQDPAGGFVSWGDNRIRVWETSAKGS